MLLLQYPAERRRVSLELSVDAEAAVDVHVLTENGVTDFENGEEQVGMYRSSRNRREHFLRFSPAARERWGLLVINRTNDEVAVHCEV